MSARRWGLVAVLVVGVAALLIVGNLSEPAGDLARMLALILAAGVVVLAVVGLIARRQSARRAVASPHRDDMA